MATGSADWNARLRVIVSFVILVMFVVSWGVSIYDRTYNPPAVIHGLMVILAGSLYGSAVTRRSPDRSEDS